VQIAAVTMPVDKLIPEELLNLLTPDVRIYRRAPVLRKTATSRSKC
jgi:hypothetical protein